MIIIRIDVDYPYSSRLKSFINVALGVRLSRDYLKNAKIIAKMINASEKRVKAYWFFTPKTILDQELRLLLDSNKHEIGLHVVNDPIKEQRFLEEAAGKRIEYYTIHGTTRFLARIIWKRWKNKAPKIPDGYQLCSFHQYPTFGLDSLCYIYNSKDALDKANDNIRRGQILYFHPIWLFRRGKLNHRGPFYETLKRILDVDKEIETLYLRRKVFLKIASDTHEYEKDIAVTKDFIGKLSDREIDVFTFIERRWCRTFPKASKFWARTEDNIALLQVTTYDQWWQGIGKKTRNMIRKAEKSGIVVEVAEPNEKLAEGIWKIYNETPIRQERAFPHYSQSLQAVRKQIADVKDTFIAAYLQNETIGFMQLVYGERIAMVSQILSLQEHSDKAVNNALIAKAVEVCASKGCGWLMYARMGNHPSLDNFKRNNGFRKFPLTRYYVPITRRGRIAIRIGLHRDIKDVLPERVKYLLIPIYNWVSRNKTRFRRQI